jgi:nucleoside-diphosphate-sugar epimerase
MKKTLLITGGAGFLGYHLCNRLSKNFKEIIILDIAPFYTEEFPKNVKYYNIDITNKSQLEQVIKKEKPDLIIHGAAALPLYKSSIIWNVNVNGTKNVLEIALQNKVERVTFISSTAVYGVPEKHPLYEDDPLIGVGPYGETKILAEKICEQYRKRGLCVPIIRPKTFIGTGRLGVFQILYDWIESGKKIPVIGNGQNRYQLLEVRDLVDAIYLTLVKPKTKANDTFNVGAKDFHTVESDVGAVCRYAKSGARVFKTPAPVVIFLLRVLEMMKLSPLYKWVYGTASKDSFVSVDKIEKQLGWKPQYSNADALIESYTWYLANKHKLGGTGVTHRVAWSQGALAIVKKFM